MRFEFDPESGAIYIRIKEGEIAQTLEMAEPGFGAYLDVDQEGSVLGVEFLTFDEFAELTTRAGGKLEIPDTVKESEDALSPGPRPPEHGSDAIRDALSSLAPRQQELLRLFYFEDHTILKISDRLGMSVSAVRDGIRSALAELRERLVASGALDGNTFSENAPRANDQRSLVAALSALDSE